MIQDNILRYIQCRIQQFFGGAGFSTSVARRKTVVQPGSMGRRCKPSPVGSRGETLEIFGYFVFWIAQNIALCLCNKKHWWKLTPEINTFEHLGVWVWDPKPVYRLQNSSGYGTDIINHLNNLAKLANVAYIWKHCLDLAFFGENFSRNTRYYQKSKTFLRPVTNSITEDKFIYPIYFEECRRIRE